MPALFWFLYEVILFPPPFFLSISLYLSFFFQTFILFQKKYPDWYANRSVTDYLPLLRENHRYFLNKRDKHGRRVYINKLGKLYKIFCWISSKYQTTISFFNNITIVLPYMCVGSVLPKNSIYDVAQLDDMFFEAVLSEYETQIKGLTIIIDFKKIPWTYLKWCHPKLVRIGADKSDVMPLKELEVHVVNTSKIMSIIVNTVRPVMPQRIIDKVCWSSTHVKHDSYCNLLFTVYLSSIAIMGTTSRRSWERLFAARIWWATRGGNRLWSFVPISFGS